MLHRFLLEVLLLNYYTTPRALTKATSIGAGMATPVLARIIGGSCFVAEEDPPGRDR